MSETCPKCGAEDQEGEDLGKGFVLFYECSECGHQFDSSQELIEDAYEQGKNQRKYGRLA